MKRPFTVTSSVVLGLFFLMVIAATQAVTAQQPPVDHRVGSHAPTRVQHTQPITPGAPADVALILDRSESQSYDFAALPSPYSDVMFDGRTRCYQNRINDMYACVNGGTLEDGTTVAGCNNEIVSDPAFPELTHGICQPFRKSKEAAYRFIQQLRPDADRVALLNFAETPARVLSMTSNFAGAINAINGMNVFVSRPDGTDGHIPCRESTPFDEWWKCGSSNIGGALLQVRTEFSSARPRARWSAILIADGPANRTSYDPRVPWSEPSYGNCPLSERSTLLKCRDGDVNSRHFITSTVDPLYDADDYAREYGDLLGLNPSLYPALNSAGIEIFTISFGKSTVCLTGNYTPPSNGQPATCTRSNPGYGDPDAAEQLLRYIADMGDDGNLSTGSCLDTQAPFRVFETRADASGRSDDVGLGLSCGNYYFAPDASSLPTITLDIAARIVASSALLPEFSATPLTGFSPLVVTFTNQSTGDFTSWLWQFGDGATSADLNPTHIYATGGIFSVTLTLTNPTASATLTRTNYIDVSAPQWRIYLPVIQKSS
jgi:hypothetical protein